MFVLKQKLLMPIAMRNIIETNGAYNFWNGLVISSSPGNTIDVKKVNKSIIMKSSE